MVYQPLHKLRNVAAQLEGALDDGNSFTVNGLRRVVNNRKSEHAQGKSKPQANGMGRVSLTTYNDREQ
jgi:hypothetical protein